jgi:hypothetical protein
MLLFLDCKELVSIIPFEEGSFFDEGWVLQLLDLGLDCFNSQYFHLSLAFSLLVFLVEPKKVRPWAMVMISEERCCLDFDTKPYDIKEEVLVLGDLVDSNTFIEVQLMDSFKFKRVHVIGYFYGEN